MSEASDQITEYLSVGGLFNPEMMNQTQHEAVRDTLIKARDDIQRLERWNAALREQVEELDAKWKMAEDQCFDQVGKIGELERENAALRAHAERVGEANDRLVVESDELRKDQERLDWLTNSLGWIVVGNVNEADPSQHAKEGDTLADAWRAAIDAAMKEAQQ